MNRLVTQQLPDTHRQERLQRIRIAVTGLAAVFLVVMSAGVLTGLASNETPVDQQADVEAPGGLPELVNNKSKLIEETKHQEPLAELGVAPSTGPTAATSDPSSNGTKAKLP